MSALTPRNPGHTHTHTWTHTLTPRDTHTHAKQQPSRHVSTTAPAVTHLLKFSRQQLIGNSSGRSKECSAGWLLLTVVSWVGTRAASHHTTPGGWELSLQVLLVSPQHPMGRGGIAPDLGSRASAPDLGNRAAVCGLCDCTVKLSNKRMHQQDLNSYSI